MLSTYIFRIKKKVSRHWAFLSSKAGQEQKQGSVNLTIL